MYNELEIKIINNLPPLNVFAICINLISSFEVHFAGYILKTSCIAAVASFVLSHCPV
jgi:hypothetical protein